MAKSSTKYGIEMAGANNDQIFFNPLQEAFRGRYDSSKVAGVGMNAGLGNIIRAAPVIPGMYLVLDVAEKTLTIFDPLNTTADGKQIWAKIKPILDQNRNALGGPYAPIETRTVKIDEQHQSEMTEDDAVKNYAWCMRQLVDGGNARVLSEFGNFAELPSAKEIDETWPGRRLRDYGYGRYSGATGERADNERFVTPKGKAAKKEAVPAE